MSVDRTRSTQSRTLVFSLHSLVSTPLPPLQTPAMQDPSLLLACFTCLFFALRMHVHAHLFCRLSLPFGHLPCSRLGSEQHCVIKQFCFISVVLLLIALWYSQIYSMVKQYVFTGKNSASQLYIINNKIISDSGTSRD